MCPAITAMKEILEKQNVTQLLIKSRSFIDNETSLPLSKYPATGKHTTVEQINRDVF
jgi:hypothetical protein